MREILVVALLALAVFVAPTAALACQGRSAAPPVPPITVDRAEILEA